MQSMQKSPWLSSILSMLGYIYGVSNIGGFSAGAQHKEHNTLGYATGGPRLESTRFWSLCSELLLTAGKVAPWESKLET